MHNLAQHLVSEQRISQHVRHVKANPFRSMLCQVRLGCSGHLLRYQHSPRGAALELVAKENSQYNCMSAISRTLLTRGAVKCFANRLDFTPRTHHAATR